MSRFLAFPLKGISGLSFVSGDCVFISIHAHTRAQPLAELPHDIAVYQEIGRPKLYQLSDLTWLYLPMPPGEEILAIGICSSSTGNRLLRPCIVVRGKNPFVPQPQTA